MSVLDQIFEHKRDEVTSAKRERSVHSLRAESEAAPATLGFARAVHAAEGVGLIAEVKKASPSQGLIRPDFDPAGIAAIYEEAGAQALSVLTDERYFQGSALNLRRAREATSLPILRKDFIFDPYQIYEARAWGADAVLLIVAALEEAQLRDLQALAGEADLDVLCEVHDEAESDRALEAGFSLIGVNNRDLRDFSVSLSVTERLAPRITPHADCVSESAIETLADVRRVEAAGVRAVLIGTTFCAAPDIGQKVHEVMGR